MPTRATPKDRRADAMPCRLDGIGLAIDFKGLERVPIAAQRQLVDDGEEPGDRSINGQGSWKRTCWSFDHGAGQSWWDEDQDADRRQFRHSMGIDPWDRRELKLLHDVTDVSSVSTVKLVEKGTGLYTLAADGKLDLQASPGSAWTQTGAITTGVVDVVCDGVNIFYAKATQVYSDLGGFNNGGDTSVCTSLHLAGGQLLGIEGQTIIRFSTAGNAYLVDTIETGSRWGGIVDMGGETYSWSVPVYGSGPTDDPNRRSRVYRHRVNETTTTLDPGDPVLELPPGESITAALGFSNVILVGTTKGIRLITRTSGNDLSHGGLIPIDPATSMTHQIYDFAADGQYVWFTWTNVEEGKSGLGRLDLDEFIEFGVPAYATDLMADEAYVAGTTKVRAVASVNGTRYFAGNFGGYAEASTYVSTGTYYSGWVNYGTPEHKAILSLGLKAHPLNPDEEIRGSVLMTLGVSDEYGAVAMIGEESTYADGALGVSGEVIDGEEVEVKIVLTRGSTTTLTPILRRWTLRVLPLPFRTESITLPVKVFESLRENGVGFTQDPEQLLEKLNELYQSRQLIRLDLGEESMMVYVDGVAVERDTQVTGILGWSRRKRVLEGIYGVTCITTDVPVQGEQQNFGVGG